MPTLILLRHGQSMWNQRNIFTGWVDVPLSAGGIDEAVKAGQQIANTQIDAVFTSTLVRAQQTAMIALAQHKANKVPVIQHSDEPELALRSSIHSEEEQANTLPTYIDWRLNERYYGKLQGLNKAKTAETYGDDQVKIWRRSYDIAPPEGESLAMTRDRTLPCLNERIIPALNSGKNILISAHGNSLRSIVMEIEGLSEQQVLELEIATGEPRVYQYNNKTWQRHPSN